MVVCLNTVTHMFVAEETNPDSGVNMINRDDVGSNNPASLLHY